MTPEDRADIAVKLIAMQGLLRDLSEAAGAQAELCKQVDASGLAVSAFMLEEAIKSYSRELTKWVSEYLEGNGVDTR